MKKTTESNIAPPAPARVEFWPVDKPKPYERNPRRNDAAVEKVAESIRTYGFQSPIIVDKDGIIIAGHTRQKAAKYLGLKEVPVLVADKLTKEQAAGLRIADNKTGDFSIWDNVALLEELDSLNESGLFTGFDMGEVMEGAVGEMAELDEGADDNTVPDVDGELYTVTFRHEDKSRIEEIQRLWNEMEKEG